MGSQNSMAEIQNAPLSGQLTREIQIPNLYFNGFEINSSFSDISSMLLLDGQPIARLSMSFTTAKTMAKNLYAAISAFEAATEHSILTMDEVKSGFDRQKT